jgi:hypothetical protein
MANFGPLVTVIGAHNANRYGAFASTPASLCVRNDRS